MFGWGDTELVLLVLALWYLGEGAVWIPDGTLGLVSLCGERARARLGWLFETNAGGFLLASPWPVGHVHLVPLWPVAWSAEGCFGHALQSLSAQQRPLATGRFFRWSEIERVEVEEKQVLVNGKRLATLPSAAAARALARAVETVWRAPAAERAAEIDCLLSRWCDVPAAAARREAFDRATQAAACAASALGALMFVAAPIACWRADLLDDAWRTAWQMLGLGAGLWAATLVCHYLAHRRLYPEDTAGRRKQLGSLALSPASALRSLQTLGRDLLVDSHPLAAALATADADHARQVARRLLLDQAHPLAAEGMAAPSPEGQAVVEWFLPRLRARLEQTVQAWGEAPSVVCQPPSREGDDVRSYCPRCDGQYTLSQGNCPRCPGVVLVEYA